MALNRFNFYSSFPTFSCSWHEQKSTMGHLEKSFNFPSQSGAQCHLTYSKKHHEANTKGITTRLKPTTTTNNSTKQKDTPAGHGTYLLWKTISACRNLSFKQMKQKGKDRQRREVLQQEAQSIACKHPHRQFAATHNCFQVWCLPIHCIEKQSECLMTRYPS